MIDGPPRTATDRNYEAAIVNNRQRRTPPRVLAGISTGTITDGNKASFLDQVHFQPLPPAVVVSDALIATISS